MKTLEENGWTLMLGTTDEHDAIARATPKLTGAEGIEALEALRAMAYGEATPRLQRVFELSDSARTCSSFLTPMRAQHANRFWRTSSTARLVERVHTRRTPSDTKSD